MSKAAQQEATEGAEGEKPQRRVVSVEEWPDTVPWIDRERAKQIARHPQIINQLLREARNPSLHLLSKEESAELLAGSADGSIPVLSTWLSARRPRQPRQSRSNRKAATNNERPLQSGSSA